MNFRENSPISSKETEGSAISPEVLASIRNKSFDFDHPPVPLDSKLALAFFKFDDKPVWLAENLGKFPPNSLNRQVALRLIDEGDSSEEVAANLDKFFGLDRVVAIQLWIRSREARIWVRANPETFPDLVTELAEKYPDKDFEDALREIIDSEEWPTSGMLR